MREKATLCVCVCVRVCVGGRERETMSVSLSMEFLGMALQTHRQNVSERQPSVSIMHFMHGFIKSSPVPTPRPQ